MIFVKPYKSVEWMYCLMLLLFWFHFYKAWFTREVHQRHVLWHALVSRIRHTRVRWWNPSYCILTESWEFNCTIYGWLYSNTNELKFNGNATERCAHILKLPVVLYCLLDIILKHLGKNSNLAKSNQIDVHDVM